MKGDSYKIFITDVGRLSFTLRNEQWLGRASRACVRFHLSPSPRRGMKTNDGEDGKETPEKLDRWRYLCLDRKWTIVLLVEVVDYAVIQVHYREIHF